MYKITCMMLALFLCEIASGQKAVSREMQNLVASGIEFQKTDLFKFETTDVHRRDLDLQGLSAGTILNLDLDAIQHLFQEQQNFISLSVPLTERTNMVLTLKRHEIFTSDFKLFTSSDPVHPIDYTPGLHYMGIVEGDPNSIVALSVFKDQVMAMIATDEGNLVIGPITGDVDNRHIFYNDRDLERTFDFECGTADDGLAYTEDQLKPLQTSRDMNDCVRLHIEIDDNIVTEKGGAVNAVNYVTAMFNQSFLIYTQESINMVISEIFAWTTESPYTGTTQTQLLSSYQQNTEFFNGDLSQLVTYSAVGGKAGGFSGVCNGNPDLSKCFSHVDTSFNNFPVYSWTVFVITHEVGHLLGSRHTQACVWNGNNTPIDGCYAPEGACSQPPIPPDGGTIMSYCYLPSSGSYVDLTNGFGPQPGTVIRNTVDAAGNCLTTCGQPTSYCSSNGANTSTEYIDKIVLGTINNQSGNNGGYGNYTSLSTNLVAGTTYSIALTPKFTGGNKVKSWRVWIDYNQDFDWYDAGEVVAQGTGSNSLNITFTVPAYSPTVTTRMRVSMKYTGYPAFCGTFPVGEVEDYTVSISGAPTPTCSDGIQNQGEEGVDCGAPCPAVCPTCLDGIQNQNETGIDCGGVCPACPTGDSTVLLASYFETGWDSWIDGGPDAARVSSSNSWEGQYSIALADNSGAQSAMTSPVFDLSTAVGLQMTFHFKAISMESGEDFWVQYKNGSGPWSTIASFISGSQFNNNSYYFVSLTVPSFVPTSAGSLRIQCDASDNNDQVFIDAVTILKLNGAESIEAGVAIQPVEKPGIIPTQDIGPEKALLVYPNPANELLIVQLPFSTEVNVIMEIIDITGQRVSAKKAESEVELQTIDVSSLPQGLYFLQVIANGRVRSMSKFAKL